MDKLKIQFSTKLLAKTLGLPEGVEILGVKHDLMGHSNDPQGTHVTIMVGGDFPPKGGMVFEGEPDSLVDLCKDYFEDGDT